jgi:hypothetical protein
MLAGMKCSTRRSTGLLLACACLTAAAAEDPAPVSFELGYRAWDVVTDIARHNHKADLSGDCGTHFRPFVIPGLRPQSPAEQAAAAQACVRTARTVCADPALARTEEMAKKCSELK